MYLEHIPAVDNSVGNYFRAGSLLVFGFDIEIWRDRCKIRKELNYNDLCLLLKVWQPRNELSS